MGASYHKMWVIKSARLLAEPEALRVGFLALASADDLADLLECTKQQLIYWARIASSWKRYRTFEISKRSGTKRTIEAPHVVLQMLQRKLLQVLENVYEPRAPVHGFVKGRGILTNAAPHVRRSWVLNIDLAEFFPSIHFGRVRGIFRAKPFQLPDPVAIIIAQLVCSNTRLPQGAPTSPIVANIVCMKMDSELRRFAKEHGAMYTRYADDITFSVRRRSFPQGIAALSEPEPGVHQASLSEGLVAIIEENGFRINEAKTRIQPWKRSQRVTGLVVNEKPNVPRRFVRRTRAMLHAWRVHGLVAAEAKFIESYAGDCKNKRAKPSFKRRVRGNIAYIGQIRGRDDALYLRLLALYHQRIGQPIPEVPKAMTDNTTKRDVFICHASEDKLRVVDPLAEALRDAGISCWYDKAEIGWGDPITAKINQGLATSRYVLVVISRSFLPKRWPQKELQAALGREIGSGETSVLPLMVGQPDEIEQYQAALPLQADKRHLVWTADPAPIVASLRALLDKRTTET